MAPNPKPTLTLWKESGLGERKIDWASYLREQRMIGADVDDLVIHCAATFLGKDIYVTTQQHKNIWRLMNSHAGTRGTPITLASNQSSEKDDNGQLRLGGEHFQSLIPTGKGENETETCRGCGQQNIKRLKSHLNNSKKKSDQKLKLF